MSDPISTAKNDALEPKGKVKQKKYERKLAELHVELVKLQQWVVHKGLKVCILFEGRDGAGKGGTIKAMTEREISRPKVSCRKRQPRGDEKETDYPFRVIPEVF
jgi:polyphosphate kinase 2 (PPK2 family)